MTSLTPLWTYTEREISRFLRVWTQSLIPSIMTSGLFILIFGYSLGSRISSVSGVSYIEFIIPGLVMMGMLMSSYLNTSFSLYLSKFQGNIQEVLVAPISYWQIIVGLTIAAVIRAILVGVCIIIVGMIFTPIHIYHFGVLVYFMFMVSLLFAFAGIITALWADSFDKVSVFSNFLITPLTYLGGIFYSISMLPPTWATIAKFNPILYMVDGFRYGFLGTSDIPILYSALLVMALTLLFFGICVHLFRIGFRLRT